jgi:S-adenosylmethionine hydrolase
VAILTLTSDFGLHDPYVGIMKSRIVQRAPQLQLIDLTHQLEPFAIAAAGYWLYCVQPQFPAGTVHLAVVDPGVGGARAIVVLEAGGQCFVAPDNGLLDLLAQAWPASTAYSVGPGIGARLELPQLSATFHGRDLMAPLAAELAVGRITPAELGPTHRLRSGTLRPGQFDADGTLKGVVGVIDRYGNLLTTITASALGEIPHPRIQFGGQCVRLVRTYTEGARDEPIALINSAGMLELAVREGSAARQLNARAGDPVVVSMPAA